MENRLTKSSPEAYNMSAGPGVQPQRPGESSMLIDMDYNPLSPNVQHKANAASHEPEEMKKDNTEASVGPIKSNIGEHQ